MLHSDLPSSMVALLYYLLLIANAYHVTRLYRLYPTVDYLLTKL